MSALLKLEKISIILWIKIFAVIATFGSVALINANRFNRSNWLAAIKTATKKKQKNTS